MEYKIYSNIVQKKALRKVQSETLALISDTLANSFGPDGQNTAYRRQKDIARYTKDGHTILKNINFRGTIEFSIRDDLEAITRRIITTVGDGTTSAIILSYCIFEGLCHASERHHINEKKLVADLNEAIKKASDIIMTKAIEPTLENIRKVALISTDNNEFVANLIEDIYRDFGNDVFIDVTAANGVETYTREYDGYSIQSGLADIAFINTDKHTCEIHNPYLYLFEDPIDTEEMIGYFAKIIKDNVVDPVNENRIGDIKPTVIVCPKIGRDIESDVDALVRQMAALSVQDRKKFPINIVTNINDANYINDLSYLSGATLIRKYNDIAIQTADYKIAKALTPENVHSYAGRCDICVTDSAKTKFINPALMYGPDGELTDLYKNHLKDMEENIKGLRESNASTTDIGLLKRRINAYKANMVEIFVGGISETDRDSLRDLVEDAVLNCRSAASEGIGFGANFEAFRAFNYLLAEDTKGMSELEIKSIANGEKYNIYQLICNAYVSLLAILYSSAADGDMNKAIAITNTGITKGCPYNIRTQEYDGAVLSSIKSDPIILDAIGKIIGVVFLTNQFFVSSAEFNIYQDMIEEENNV